MWRISNREKRGLSRGGTIHEGGIKVDIQTEFTRIVCHMHENPRRMESATGISYESSDHDAGEEET